MSDRGRILFICYDALRPSGGVKVIYAHVSHLVKNGYPAFVVHQHLGFKPPWLSQEVRALYMEKTFQMHPNDIVVIPEDHRAALQAFQNIPVRKFVFCQNHFYIFKGLEGHTSWEDYGISGIFCCSEIIGDFISSLFKYDEVPVIHNAVDPDIFMPREKRLQIAYMPRKRPFEVEFMKNVFQRFNGQSGQVPWIPMDGLTEGEVARVLGESSIFLSTSLYEGFGLPPLEAMACGCVVVGFHGWGGQEYATPENGYWCLEGNVIECARKLQEVIALFDGNPKEIEGKVRHAAMTAGQYTTDRQERDVLNFWEGVHG